MQRPVDRFIKILIYETIDLGVHFNRDYIGKWRMMIAAWSKTMPSAQH